MCLGNVKKSSLTGAWDEVRGLKRQVWSQTSGVGDLAWFDSQGRTGPQVRAGLPQPPWEGPRRVGEVRRVSRTPTLIGTGGYVL